MVVLICFLMRQSESESPEEIESAFKLFDYDDKGEITFENLKQVA